MKRWEWSHEYDITHVHAAYGVPEGEGRGPAGDVRDEGQRLEEYS